jgi:hypothetical protein
MAPWEQVPEVWPTEAKFWTWVRGVLRKGWSHHPVKIAYIQANRKKIPNPNKASSKRFPEVWGMRCGICGKEHIATNIEIDHIKGNSKFTCLEDMKSYAEHLFMVDFESLRAVCKPCHKIKTYAESKGISFEEARIEKLVIEILKDKKQTQEIIQQAGLTAKNNSERRQALLQILKGKEIVVDNK